LVQGGFGRTGCWRWYPQKDTLQVAVMLGFRAWFWVLWAVNLLERQHAGGCGFESVKELKKLEVDFFQLPGCVMYLPRVSSKMLFGSGVELLCMLTRLSLTIWEVKMLAALECARA